MESQADGQSLKYTLLRAVYKKKKEKKSTVLLTLSADVGILLHVAIHKVGIDVVWCGISISQRQCDTWVVVTQNVRVAILRQVVTSPATDNKGCYHPDLPHCFLWLKARVVITQTFLTAPCDSRQQGLLSLRPSSLLLVTQDNKGCYHPDLPHCSLWLMNDNKGCYHQDLPHCSLWLIDNKGCYHPQGLLSPRPSSLLLVTQDNMGCNFLDLPHCDWKQQKLLPPRPSSLLLVTQDSKGWYHPDLPLCDWKHYFLWLKTTKAVITQTLLTAPCDSRQQELLPAPPRPSPLHFLTQDTENPNTWKVKKIAYLMSDTTQHINIWN